MKYHLFLLFTLSVFTSQAQVKDTTHKSFLKTGELYSFFYVDKDKNSPFIKKLETRDVIDKQLKDNTDSLKAKYKKDFDRNVQIKGLPQKWISLERYKGNYYTYFPCDFCSAHYRIKFSGNLMYWFGCENEVLVVTAAKQVSSDTYQIGTKAFLNPSSLSKISMVDREKGIAVFEFENNTYKWHMLMMDASKIRQFPVIVHKCPTDKDLEFMGFDEIDYPKLIKTGK